MFQPTGYSPIESSWKQTTIRVRLPWQGLNLLKTLTQSEFYQNWNHMINLHVVSIRKSITKSFSSSKQTFNHFIHVYTAGSAFSAVKILFILSCTYTPQSVSADYFYSYVRLNFMCSFC